ncbi:putative nucleoside-diphosphate sugar epimerase [Owenweeksia hongkongensis DSM 17368]|uniref:Putative nucleoside-diphosphate sugar epimerase n=1 Tax=Owenweeksia hongkongensis (strain DSM 17368 / CIP 108786 / JCM 12287 / NRRL B-23963 / UST20020801) TaxID=926562 RepID=G8R7X4_OWEHD|nr:NmrA family NAD(P)-binding protein [Owenweeksia hongkongensis]AEV31297.1 putative nucleoside-diphosphate sugar epimerase [Owenweeksia hongkongensis DSM 17368]
MKSNILVIGGTGKTGRKVVERLQDLQQNIRIGSRSANPSFDWQDPTNWAEVLKGIDKVYITFQPDLAVPGALKAIETLTHNMKNSDVKKVVLLSGKGEKEAELCEQVIIHSGIDYSIVRASWFMQNFSESFFLDSIVAGHVALPNADAKVPYVSTDDIAEVATEVLLDDQQNGQIYELTGPRLLTFSEVVQEISIATGRDIQFTPISLPAYSDIMRELQVPEDFIWLINYLFTEVLGAQGNDVVTSDVEKVLGRKPVDFSDFVRETAKTGVWNQVMPHQA